MDHPTGGGLGHELIVVKIVAAIVLGLGSFTLGVVPPKTVEKWHAAAEKKKPEWPNSCSQPRHRRRHSHPRDSAASGLRGAASLLLCFGGGALLSATLLLVAPEARDAADELRRDGRLPRDAEHLADVLLCAGFFAALLADQTAHAVLGRYRRTGLRARTAGDDAEMQRRDGPEDRPVAVAGPAAVTGPLAAAIVLSLHAIFGGMAVGLEVRADSAWCLLAAVATHQLAAAFRAGLQPLPRIARAAVSAAVAPVGVAFGAAIARHCSAADGSPGPVAVVLHCLVAGTLLYVAFFEVLAPRHKRSGWSYLTAVVFGFAVLSLLQKTTHHGSYNYTDTVTVTTLDTATDTTSDIPTDITNSMSTHIITENVSDMIADTNSFTTPVTTTYMTSDISLNLNKNAVMDTNTDLVTDMTSNTNTVKIMDTTPETVTDINTATTLSKFTTLNTAMVMIMDTNTITTLNMNTVTTPDTSSNTNTVKIMDTNTLMVSDMFNDTNGAMTLDTSTVTISDTSSNKNTIKIMDTNTVKTSSMTMNTNTVTTPYTPWSTNTAKIRDTNTIITPETIINTNTVKTLKTVANTVTTHPGMVTDTNTNTTPNSI